MKQIKDGYIGLLKLDGDGEDSPVVTRMSVKIEEIVDPSGEQTPFSSAKFTLSDLDVSPKSTTGITKAIVQIEDREDYNLYPETLYNRWTTIETVQISDTKMGIRGQDNVISFVVKGIPSSIIGSWHRFRIMFYNWCESTAVFKPAVDETFQFSDLINNVEPDPKWGDNQFKGMSIEVLHQINPDFAIYAKPIPVVNNTHNTIVYKTKGISRMDGSHNMEDEFFRFIKNKYYYILGENGEGIEFNGISDLKEIASIPGVSFFVDDTWYFDDDIDIPNPNNKVKLRFCNMRNRRSVQDHPFADGNTYTVLTSQWNSIKKYLIFAYVSDYPVPPKFNRPHLSEEDKGIWGMFYEIEATKTTFSKKPYIEVNLDNLPRNKYVWFYVGGYTGLGKTGLTLDLLPSFIEEVEARGSLVVSGNSEIIDNSWEFIDYVAEGGCTPTIREIIENYADVAYSADALPPDDITKWHSTIEDMWIETYPMPHTNSECDKLDIIAARYNHLWIRFRVNIEKHTKYVNEEEIFITWKNRPYSKKENLKIKMKSEL